LEPLENIRTLSVANHVISAASVTILAASVTAMQLVADNPLCVCMAGSSHEGGLHYVCRITYRRAAFNGM
jgi:hypothetical protein